MAVPDSAVIDTGDRQVVIVDKGEGSFEPRDVKIGMRGDGMAEIMEGLAEGEKVVVSANFLIDAESNLKAALSALTPAEAVKTLPLDAIPDLSDVQVIVFTDYPGQAPQVVEDQVTYPLTTSMLTVPRSKVVRGFSFFGVSFVYVIFEDGTDPYWARSRVLE
ncbi:efflux RND transporter permease subunit, partial [Mesorhizobium sp.]|uniref:efflux RND transporter permease subunit n=1 Tax=Mesorhizobium sp. TaxID=1871066 RepID=UPI002579C103